MSRKIYAVSIVLLFSLTLLPLSSLDADASQVTGIAGYIRDKDGNVIPNHEVNITNVNTSTTKTTTTDDDGLYAVSIEADNGDIIQGNFSYNNETGVANTAVDLDKNTQWLNISLVSLKAPVCRFSYSPSNPNSSTQIEFEDLSRDPDGYIVQWKWTFGDFSMSTRQNPTHTYNSEGKFKVTLMVQDNDGLWASCFDYIEVEDENTGDIIIPPMPPPKYEDYYTVPEMYEMLKINKVGSSNGNGNVKVAVIDSGVTKREYRGYNMHLIEALKHPSILHLPDENGHGTWCNWAVWYGVSEFTDGNQMSLKIIENARCPASYLIDALDTVKEKGVDVVSISLGGYGKANGPVDRKVDELRRNGIIVVCAAGNYGPAPSTIITPALSDSSFAIGSVDPHWTLEHYKDDVVSEWSSRGPVQGINEGKPDVVAGGESIKGAWLNGERVVSGTSMATPVVAGGCSVVYAENEALLDFLKLEYFYWQGIVPFIFETSMEHSCVERGDINSYGHGVPQFDTMSTWVFWLGLLFALLPFIIAFVAIVVYWKVIRPWWEERKKKRREAKKPRITYF